MWLSELACLFQFGFLLPSGDLGDDLLALEGHHEASLRVGVAFQNYTEKSGKMADWFTANGTGTVH